MPIQPVDEFFSTADFATAATYTDAAGKAKSVLIIFDEAFTETRIGQDVYANLKPTAYCKTADVRAATTACTLTFTTVKDGETVWRMIGVEPDVLGITRIFLSKDPP